MSVKIRLRRTGKPGMASHRIVVCDSRSPRDGRFIEIIGYYDPRHEDEKIDVARAEYWIGVGAQPSDTVKAILERTKSGKGPKKAADKPAKKAAPAPAAEAAPSEA